MIRARVELYNFLHMSLSCMSHLTSVNLWLFVLQGTQVDAHGGGDEALAALQQLPPSGILRNDFTHLGLQVLTMGYLSLYRYEVCEG